MADKVEISPPIEEEKKIPVFTVLKNGTILKNIFLLDNSPPCSNQEKDQFEEILVVGRHPDCNITLEHPSISRFHLRIHSKPSSFSLSVTDLSSVHGTWISGKKIESGVKVELKEGDRMQLGGSSRVYRLHWVPISHAYDLENPILAESEPEESTQAEQHKDESGLSLQNDQIQKEDDDMVQGLDSSFSGMSSLPLLRSLTPPMLEQMRSPFPGKYKAANQNLPGNIHEEGEISLPQPAYKADKENSAPEALLVSGQSPNENADNNTLPRSHQRCSSIWSRRGKPSSVHIQTGRYRAMNEKIDIETEVESLNREIAGTVSVSKDLFTSGNKDKEEEVFTPDKEKHTPSSLFLGSMKKSCLSEMTNRLDRKSVLSNMDETDEEIFTPDKENLTPETRRLRLMKKIGSHHQIKLPRPFKPSSLKLVVEPKFNQAAGCVSYKKEKQGLTTKSTQSNMDENDEEIFTPDKENMTPDTHVMRSMIKIGKLEDLKHLESFKFSLDNVVDPIFHQNGTPFYSEKDNLTENVLEEQKSEILAVRNPARSEVNTVKNRMDRVPLQSLLVNYPGKTRAIFPEEDINFRDNPIKHLETKENEHAMEQKRWTIVVDTSSLLNKESRKSLQLLQGLKGTYMIIPRTVIRELDCMKRRANLFRRTTEVSAALEWIEDCMVNAKSWIHVQSCAEETRAVAPTPPATAPFSLSREENDMIPVGSLQFSPHSDRVEFSSPTAEDHILEYALFFKRTNRNGQLVLLSNDLTMKIKAMAEGLNCETAEEFRESLVNPFSERFLWKDSSPRGRTWSCEDDFVLRETYYHGPPKKPSMSGEAAKGLKLVLLHNSHYRHHNNIAS